MSENLENNISAKDESLHKDVANRLNSHGCEYFNSQIIGEPDLSGKEVPKSIRCDYLKLFNVNLQFSDNLNLAVRELTDYVNTSDSGVRLESQMFFRRNPITGVN